MDQNNFNVEPNSLTHLILIGVFISYMEEEEVELKMCFMRKMFLYETRQNGATKETMLIKIENLH